MNNNQQAEPKRPYILIVDDFPNNIQVIAATLKRENYVIAAAANGKKALAMVDERLPDLIFLDIMMPEMDGYEVCRRLKANPLAAAIPVIFITAKSESDDIVKGFALGAVDYVSKPFQAAELLARTRAHLELKLSRDELALASERHERSSNERKELLHMLSHDLANPVGSLVEALKLTNENPELFPELKEDMLATSVNAWELLKLVKNITVLEQDAPELSLMRVNLLNSINEATFMMKGRLEQKQIRLAVSLADDLEVVAEPVSLVNSTINNILSNAIKFSRRGSQIEVSAERHGYQIKLKFVDHGIGIPEDIMGDLFKFNKRTARFGTEGEQGTGFGMPVVKKFVNFYGGDIQITSRPEELYPDSCGTETVITFNT